MTDESLILDIDILEYKYEKLFAEADAKFAKLDAEFTAKKKRDFRKEQRDCQIKGRTGIIKNTIALLDNIRGTKYTEIVFISEVFYVHILFNNHYTYTD